MRTVAVTGVDPGSSLRRLVDQRGAVYGVPPDGAVLTAAFARLLGARPGDTP